MTKPKHVRNSDAQSHELPISTAEQWKAVRIGKPQKLPSGVVVRIRQLDLLDCIAADIIPLTLFDSVQQLISSAGPGGDEAVDVEAVDKQTMLDLSKSLRGVAVKAVVEPTVTEIPTDDPSSICVSDIPESDLMAIFGHAIGKGAQFFNSFRTERPKHSTS